MKKVIDWEWFRDHCDYLECDCDCLFDEDPDNMTPCERDLCPLWPDLEDVK